MASILTIGLLVVLTAIAAVLRLVHLGQVPGNPFYDAAVRTMARSWHAFLFGALDPSGGVSVDKPPVDLWMQVVSVKLFGFTPAALKLPQALAGTACVPLLYDLVRRPAGRVAGLAAAAALAVLPVSVVTARSDTMDTFMAFLVLLAAWLVVRAIESRRTAWLLAAGVAVGLAFNVKLFQALLPLPALALLWAIGARVPLRRRVLAGVAALLVAALVGMAWIVPVALTPASVRPYPIGSTNGSVWNLVFVFNGLDRLHGRPVTTPDTLPAGSRPSAAIVRSQQRRSRSVSTASAGRLFDRRFGAWIGSELLPALVAFGALVLTALAFRLRRRRVEPFELAGGLTRAATLSLGLWAVLGALLFSVMSRFHPRYFETLSPAVAGLLGLSLCLLIVHGRRPGWLLAALVLIATGAFARSLGGVGRYELAACVGGAVLLAALALRPPRSAGVLAGVAAVAIAAVLIVPTSESVAVVRTRAFDAERSGSMPGAWPPLLTRYLRAHRDGTRYSFASVAPAKAAPLIAADPQPVLMLTSYRSRPLISVPQLARLVRRGEVRYFLIGHRCTSALTRTTPACPANARWAIAHSTDVTRAAGLQHRGLLYRIDRPALARR
jgi:4-amino-4-deoxy-L-arabinose transferase-like glycosyltransferase